MNPLRRSRPAVAVALLAGILALQSPAPAGANPFLPPPGTTYAGVTGGLRPPDYNGFVGLTGHHSPVWQLFLTWSYDVGSMQYLAVRLQDAARLQTRLMIHLTTASRTGREVLSPASLAAGSGDAYLLNLNRVIGASNQIVYVRPYAEMNNASNVYSSRRGAGHSPASFRNAFRRTVLILRGGDVAAINARLRALHMPAVHTSAATLPAPSVAILWCPHVVSTAGSARSYYPGGAYLDWMCTDIYSGGAPFGSLSSIYASFPGKPFAIAEWGFDTFRDDPGFVTRLFAWVRSHPRTRIVLYNQGNRPGGPFRLQRYGRSAAALRRILASPRYRTVP